MADLYVYASYIMLLHPNETFCASANSEIIRWNLDPKVGRVIVPYDDGDLTSDSTLTNKFRRGTNVALKSNWPLA